MGTTLKIFGPKMESLYRNKVTIIQGQHDDMQYMYSTSQQYLEKHPFLYLDLRFQKFYHTRKFQVYNKQ